MALNINGTTGISGVDGSASAPALQGTDSNTGINFASDTVNINTGGVTRASLSSVGKFSIEHATSGNVAAEIHTSGSGLGNQLHLHNDHGLAYLGQAGDTTGDFIVYNGSNSNMLFSTNATECARFISSGFLKAKGNAASYQNASSGYHELIGDTSHDVVAKLQHKSSSGYGLQMLLNHANSSIYALAVRDYSSGNNDKAFIRGDGDLENANNSYGGISDVKLKENIVDAKSQWDDIKALKVRNFNFKIDESKTKLLGLVAQEAEAVCPSLVKTHPDLGENNEDLGTETKVLKYSIVYMKAIKALQEAQTRIETLETKVAALEAG